MKIEIIKNILDANDQVAVLNREFFDDLKVFTINIMSSPGAGKTSFILETISRLDSPSAVIEGDVASSIDSEKMAEFGIPVVQINTGGNCHLDAPMIREAIKKLSLNGVRYLFIENIGNLICPASFDLGEHIRVAISSVPEGDDKPYKYPGLFSKVEVVILNKIDLMPYVNFDPDRFRKGIIGINRNAKIFPLSCKTKEGIEAWIDWLKSENPYK
ncbi:MAG: hydrogenase nickel incorporation protein HypB [bacterium]|nr:hydrogenase nickel incorporation protein HypB [bacterium]